MEADNMKKGKIMMAVCFILAIICIVYGIFVRAAGSGTAFFMVWILGGICLLIAGILLRKGVLQRLPRIWRIVFGGLLAAGVILFLVVEGLILGSFHEKGEKGLSYLLVLGSQVYADGPSLVLQYRLDTAIGYLKENPETICIVSGGQGYNEPMTEAEGMARYLEQNGIAAERILLEDQSKTTQQNMEFSRKLIPEGASLGVVTNNFHLYRAMQIAKRQGLVQAVGIAAPSSGKYLANNMLREFFGWLKMVLLD